MSERTRDLFKYHQEGSVKFDYFLCSVAGALFAYIAQTGIVQKFSSPFAICQTVGLLVLAVSFYAGVRRIQYTNAMLRYNHDVLDADERATEIQKKLAENPLVQQFPNHGRIETRIEVEQRKRHAKHLLDRVTIRES